MVEPMHAPLLDQDSCEDDANIIEDYDKINRIGVTKEYNLLIGFNQRQTDEKVP